MISLQSIILLIASAFLHALWNALGKKSENPSRQVTGILIIASLIAWIFSLFTLFFEIPYFTGLPFPNSSAWYWGLLAGVCEGGYFISLALALSHAPVGVAYIIMRGGAMLIVYAISATLLQEKINLMTLAGIGTALMGLYFSSQGQSGKNNSTSETQRPRFLWSYICAFFIGTYHLCYSRSLNFGANPSWLFSLSLALALPALFIFNYRKNGLEEWKYWKSTLRGIFTLNNPWVMTGGLICTTSFLLYLMGLSHSAAGMALVLRNLSIVFAQFFALVIGEKVSPIQWIGSILVAVGASLVSLSR